ncbi:hypothetical protein LJX78_07635 [Methanimicrococcus blatticola]|uniref:hypothetical protein n=1 Tax=Methanimicrococcus blatticola TaxID=91560 RepID=UPI001E28B75C|nr:hypothetical protein [Methanimicrococcus blatticola]MCC2509459.1 hypothetical protein [Methanimicrococcus blatticola]
MQIIFLLLQFAFLRASALFYHIRSLRERGHCYLPFALCCYLPFALLPLPATPPRANNTVFKNKTKRMIQF